MDLIRRVDDIHKVEGLYKVIKKINDIVYQIRKITNRKPKVARLKSDNNCIRKLQKVECV